MEPTLSNIKQGFFLGNGQEFTWGPGGEYLVLPEDPCWIHVDGTQQADIDWLKRTGLIPPIWGDYFFLPRPRPELEVTDKGILLIVRGINPNLDADPEDTVAVRMWVAESHIITMSKRRSAITEKLAKQIRAHKGPKTPIEALFELGRLVMAEIGNLLTLLEDRTDVVEAQVLAPVEDPHDNTLAEIANSNIQIHRHLVPLRDAIRELIDSNSPWVGPNGIEYAKDLQNRCEACLGESELIRARMQLIQQQIDRHINRQIERRSHMFSVIACVILPINLLTGLFGMNVGGIPWNTSDYGFLYNCLIAAGIMICTIGILQRNKWL